MSAEDPARAGPPDRPDALAPDEATEPNGLSDVPEEADGGDHWIGKLDGVDQQPLGRPSGSTLGAPQVPDLADELREVRVRLRSLEVSVRDTAARTQAAMSAASSADTSRLDAVEQGLERRLSSIEEELSGVRDAASYLRRASGFVDEVRGALADERSAARDAARQFGEAMVGALRDRFEAMDSKFAHVAKVLEKLAGQGEAIRETNVKLEAAATNAEAGANQRVEQLRRAMAGTIEALKDRLHLVNESLDAIRGDSRALKEAVDAGAAGRRTAGEEDRAVAGVLLEALREMSMSFEERINSVQGHLERLPRIGEALDATRGSVQELVNGLRGELSAAVSALREEHEGATSKLEARIQGAVGELSASTKGAVGDVRAEIAGAVGLMQKVVTAVEEQNASTKGAAEELSASTKGAIEELSASTKGAVGDVRAEIAGAVGSMQKVIMAIGEQIRRQADGLSELQGRLPELGKQLETIGQRRGIQKLIETEQKLMSEQSRFAERQEGAIKSLVDQLGHLGERLDGFDSELNTTVRGLRAQTVGDLERFRVGVREALGALWQEVAGTLQGLREHIERLAGPRSDIQAVGTELEATGLAVRGEMRSLASELSSLQATLEERLGAIGEDARERGSDLEHRVVASVTREVDKRIEAMMRLIEAGIPQVESLMRMADPSQLPLEGSESGKGEAD